MEDTSAKKKEKKGKKFDFNKMLGNLKMEFERIIWPDQDSLVKSTIAVVSSSVLLGVIIAVVDMLVKFGLGLIIA